MADVIIGFKSFYEVNDETAAMFVAAGLGKYIPKAEQPQTPPPPKQDTFGVGLIGDTALPVIILTRPSGEKVRFDGRPEDAAKSFAAIGAKIPEEIVNQYGLQYPQSAIAQAAARKNAEVLAQARNAQAKHDGSGTPRW